MIYHTPIGSAERTAYLARLRSLLAAGAVRLPREPMVVERQRSDGADALARLAEIRTGLAASYFCAKENTPAAHGGSGLVIFIYT